MSDKTGEPFACLLKEKKRFPILCARLNRKVTAVHSHVPSLSFPCVKENPVIAKVIHVTKSVSPVSRKKEYNRIVHRCRNASLHLASVVPVNLRSSVIFLSNLKFWRTFGRKFWFELHSKSQ